jgi:hypothetical protein
VLDRLLEKAAAGAETGVGEYRVDPPEALEGGGDQRLDLVPLGDVAADREGAIAATELRDQLLERLGSARGERQPVAPGRGAGGGGADPAAGAGD